MTNEQLLDIIGEADGAYVLGARKYRDGIVKTEGKRIAYRKIWLIAAIIALCLLLVGCTVAYVGGYLPDNWFEFFFSGRDETQALEVISPEQQELLEQGLVNVGQSVTSNGYTVTMDYAITDGYNAYLKFRVDAPEGEMLAGYTYRFGEVPIEILGDHRSGGQVSVSSAGWQQLEDNDAEDGSIVLLLELSDSNPEESTAKMTEGTEYTIVLNTLQKTTYSGEIVKTVVAEGEWEFTFSFDDSGSMDGKLDVLTVPVRCTAHRWLWRWYVKTSVKVTSFELRAMTATLTYEEPWYGYGTGIYLDTIYVVLDNGTRIPAIRSSGSNDMRGIIEEIYRFNMPISFADVDYVAFPGGEKVYIP